MAISIYSSGFNLKSSGINWREAIINFSSFAEEVILSINIDEEDSLELVSEYIKDKNINNIILVKVFESLSSPLFDGKNKNTALQNCSNDICVSLDLDERIRLKDRYLWEQMSEYLLSQEDSAAFFVPSVNLCGSLQTYKDISFKWYIHKRHFQGKKLERGVVNFAKNQNGTIQIDKSDTCELILDGELVPAIKLPGRYDIETIKNLNLPFVFHLWAVDLEQRLKQNTFWSPIWTSRAGHSVNDILMKKEDLEKIEVYPHNLELW